MWRRMGEVASILILTMCVCACVPMTLLYSTYNEACVSENTFKPARQPYFACNCHHELDRPMQFSLAVCLLSVVFWLHTLHFLCFIFTLKRSSFVSARQYVRECVFTKHKLGLAHLFLGEVDLY